MSAWIVEIAVPALAGGAEPAGTECWRSRVRSMSEVNPVSAEVPSLHEWSKLADKRSTEHPPANARDTQTRTQVLHHRECEKLDEVVRVLAGIHRRGMPKPLRVWRVNSRAANKHDVVTVECPSRRGAPDHNRPIGMADHSEAEIRDLAVSSEALNESHELLGASGSGDIPCRLRCQPRVARRRCGERPLRGLT
jgi:hypothetical protein